MAFSGPIELLKTKCKEPCNGGGTGGGGTPPIDYQPQIDTINEHLNQNDAKLTQHDVEIANNKTSIRNINNELNNTYVTKLELSDETDKLNQRIDNIAGGNGVDFQPQIDELKNKDNQLDQRIINNSGKIQANENEINNIKTNYTSKLDLAQAKAEVMSDCNDYADAEVEKLKVSVDGNNTLITNVEGRVQVLEQNQGTGGTSNLSESFIFISVSIQDGKVLCAAYSPDNHQQINGVTWNIQHKTSHFRKGSFIEPGATQSTNSSTYSFDQYTDAITYTNARIAATVNGKQYIAGLKQTLMNTGDVDYVAGANLRLIAIRS